MERIATDPSEQSVAGRFAVQSIIPSIPKQAVISQPSVNRIGETIAVKTSGSDVKSAEA